MKVLENRVALVTGAALGMGRNLSEMLLGKGCRVALVDVNRDALKQAQKELAAKGECASYICDISNRKAVYDLAAKVTSEMGPVALLVNNAGIVKAGSVRTMDDETIERIISINLTSQFWTCRAFLPGMAKLDEAHIVNFASAGGILALPNIAAYCASKFGVVGFSDSLRQEMKKEGLNIGVTVVCPNTVNTGMFSGSKMVTGTSMLTAETVNKSVMKAIRKNRAMVAVPSIPVKFLTPLTKVLFTINGMDRLNKILGMWDANDTWTGR